jgi:hypothetical protein
MSTATFRISSPLPVTRSGPAKGLLARFCDAMVAARMRQAMVEIGRHRHLIPERTLKSAGYGPTLTNDASLPFTR